MLPLVSMESVGQRDCAVLVARQEAPDARGWSCSMHLYFSFLGILACLAHTSTTSVQGDLVSSQGLVEGEGGVVPSFFSTPWVGGAEEATPMGADPSGH